MVTIELGKKVVFSPTKGTVLVGILVQRIDMSVFGQDDDILVIQTSDKRYSVLEKDVISGGN